MPASLEAETAVLGGMMIDREAVIRAIEKVNSAAFYREGNRRIFSAMARRCSASGRASARGGCRTE